MSDDKDLAPIADEHEEERGEPDTSAPRRKGQTGKIFVIVVVMVLAALAGVGGILYFMVSTTSSNNTENVPDTTLERDSNQPSSNTDLSRTKERLERERAREAARARDAEAEAERQKRMAQQARENADSVLNNSESNAPPTGPYAGGQGANSESSRGDEEITPADRKMQGDVLVSSGSSSSPAGALQEASNSDGSLTGGSKSSAGSIGESLKGETYAAGSAKVMQNMDMLLRRGTVIPCVIQNRVVSTYSGLSSCQITQDVYSADGRTLLIERGSIAYGEQKVSLHQGQARLFMTWNEIDTAGGVRVKIDSLGVDPLGASGVDAYVDKHFWDRFGGAIMLSFIDDGLEALASRLEKNRDQDISFDSSTDNAENMAEIALRDSINIPPTGYVNQGTLMNIRVARDVDFSDVYHVRGRR
ncbi:type IV secretion system protein VirB10 [Kushneria indalinina]|nr:type IV secretion system protein VirB10 [Kushneria indalinina]